MREVKKQRRFGDSRTASPMALAVWVMVLLTFSAAGCAPRNALLTIDGLDHPLTVGTIWDVARQRAVTQEQLFDQIKPIAIIYVGERHNNVYHHDIQLQLIKALVQNGRPVRVGMEMFDHTYQDKLDRWSVNEWDWNTFLGQVHWYANWKYPDMLYKEILTYIRSQRLKLVGLNIPFDLPAKIAIGGLDSLSASQRALLPARIDTTDSEHRAYIEQVFKAHRIKGRESFDYFYEAQCAWEDGMAQAVADNLGDGQMVVLTGNGHIIRKFGIPKRAYHRAKVDYRTVYLATPDETVPSDAADFIWVTPTSARPTMR